MAVVDSCHSDGYGCATSAMIISRWRDGVLLQLRHDYVRHYALHSKKLCESFTNGWLSLRLSVKKSLRTESRHIRTLEISFQD